MVRCYPGCGAIHEHRLALPCAGCSRCVLPCETETIRICTPPFDDLATLIKSLQNKGGWLFFGSHNRQNTWYCLVQPLRRRACTWSQVTGPGRPIQAGFIWGLPKLLTVMEVGIAPLLGSFWESSCLNTCSTDGVSPMQASGCLATQGMFSLLQLPSISHNMV